MMTAFHQALYGVSFAVQPRGAPVSKSFDPLEQCSIGYHQDRCFSLLYTNNGTANNTLLPNEVDAVMSDLALQWGWTVQTAWDPSLSTPLTNAIYRVPSLHELYNFI